MPPKVQKPGSDPMAWRQDLGYEIGNPKFLPPVCFLNPNLGPKKVALDDLMSNVHPFSPFLTAAESWVPHVVLEAPIQSG